MPVARVTIPPARPGVAVARWLAAAIASGLSLPETRAADDLPRPAAADRRAVVREPASAADPMQADAAWGGILITDLLSAAADDADPLFAERGFPDRMFEDWPDPAEVPVFAAAAGEPSIVDIWPDTSRPRPPWADARFPRVARGGRRILEDYRNFYSCDSLVCLSVALGAGGIMANTGFDETVQDAWQRSVEPSGMGRFFSGCKDLGEGKYALPIFGAAIATGFLFEDRPVGGVVGEWGSRSLRVFVVGAPAMYAMQWATGASRPGETSAGSDWKPFADNNGVSGHAFVAAIPFLAAADMCESPILKGTLYVCSTFGAFSRMTDDMHYPSQAFLGWYFAFAAARAVDATEFAFSGFEVRMVPVLASDRSGLGVEARW
jgi:hypothetical protein